MDLKALTRFVDRAIFACVVVLIILLIIGVAG